MVLTIWLQYGTCWIIQKSQYCIFEWSKVRLDIANFDRIKCSPTFGKVASSWRIIQKPQKRIFEWSKEPKNNLWCNNSHFSTLSRFWRESSSTIVTFDCLQWKFSLSLKSSRKPHVPEKSGWFLAIFFCKRYRIFEWSIHLIWVKKYAKIG